MENLKKIINKCFMMSKPPVDLYSKLDDGSYYKISDNVVADIKVATENLQTELEPILKNEKEQEELMKVKSDNLYLKGKIEVYEKFLKDKSFIKEEE